MLERREAGFWLRFLPKDTKGLEGLGEDGRETE